MSETKPPPTPTKRRDFLKKAAVTTAGAAVAAATIGAPAVHARKKHTWRMATTWPPHFPVFGEAADKLAHWVDVMSEGRLKIQVYGAGELVPAMMAFDAVSRGVVEMGHGASYYWAGKSPATQFFAQVPFGMNAQQMTAWIYKGGGLEIWEDLYSRFNLIPFPVGNSGVQMGGWFNKEINRIEDYKGLKMRIPGLGGKVIAKAGGSAILVAGGEIYTNLERGVIDATEWVGPYHDYLMGFHKAAKYYYYPGWHEPGLNLEMFVNRQKFLDLPKDLQQIIRTAAYRSHWFEFAEFESKNVEYLNKLVKEENVQLKAFPEQVLKDLKKLSGEVLQEVVETDSDSRKVWDSYTAFRKKVSQWSKVTEQAYAKTFTM